MSSVIMSFIAFILGIVLVLYRIESRRVAKQLSKAEKDASYFAVKLQYQRLDVHRELNESEKRIANLEEVVRLLALDEQVHVGRDFDSLKLMSPKELMQKTADYSRERV